MIEFEVELKKWGNSIGLIVPKEELASEPLKARQKVKAIIMPLRQVKVEDIFGKARLSTKTSKLLKSIDKELASKFLE